MSARINMKRLAAGLSVLLLLFLIAGVTTKVIKGDEAASAAPNDVTMMVAGGGCDKNAVAVNALLGQGFSLDQFVIGQDHINWNEPEANERGRGAFVKETPTTSEAVVKELASDSDQSKAAFQVILDQSKAPREVVLDAKNWVPAQFKVASNLEGNTAFKDGKAVSAGTRSSAAGDVLWLFVDPAKCIQAANGELPPTEAVTAHRAGCGNPQTALPKPGPGVTPTPPKGQPPKVVTPPKPPKAPKCPNGQPLPPNGLCPKDPSKDINNNPAVPPQVRKDRPSPDNPKRIADGPTTPIDSPSGCNGPCPTTPPRPSNPGPQPTVPVAGPGATNTVAPPTTAAPPPAPPVTSSPTVTVVSP